MKKTNKYLIIVIVLLFICLIGTVSFTYAKYISSATGTADAQVATWAVKVNNTDIVQTANFSLDGDYIQWQENENIADGYIAPGRTGTMKIKLDTTGSKVAVKYTISIDQTALATYNQINITKVNSQPVTSDSYSGVITLANVDNVLEIPIEISWINQETTNESDTNIGSTVSNLSIPITVTAEQYIGA